jgi:hypothetical protein
MRENSFFSKDDSRHEIVKSTVDHFKSISCYFLSADKLNFRLVNIDFWELVQAAFIRRVRLDLAANYDNTFQEVTHSFVILSYKLISHLNILNYLLLGLNTCWSLFCVFFCSQLHSLK